jgi:hypothetical protein
MLAVDPLALDKLGLTMNNVWQFAAESVDDEFYDGVCTVYGPPLYDIIDTSPAGRGRSITCAAITVEDKGRRRVGITTKMFLDPNLCDTMRVQLTPVAWETEVHLRDLASVNIMLPARIVPTPSAAPGIRAAFADIPEHLQILHTSSPQNKATFDRRPQPAAVHLSVFSVRLDRTTAAWAAAFFAILDKTSAVVSVDVFMENIFEGLRGVNVVIGIHM